MIFLRSLAFNVFFYAHTIFWLFALMATLPLPRSAVMRGVKMWALINRRAMTVIAGVRVELRGLENIPKGGALIVSKHQSAFETVTMLDLFEDPTYVLKKELLSIPMFGWYALKAEQIPVDRKAGRTALIEMTQRARKEVARGRQIIIYPEGTRRPAGAEPAYKHGVVNLYRDLQVPIVPVALNSGLFWPRHGFMHPPGTLVLEFLPQIPPGRDPEEAFETLKEVIETASDALITEALAAPNPPPLPPEGAAYLARQAARRS